MLAVVQRDEVDRPISGVLAHHDLQKGPSCEQPHRRSGDRLWLAVDQWRQDGTDPIFKIAPPYFVAFVLTTEDSGLQIHGLCAINPALAIDDALQHVSPFGLLAV